MSTENQITGQYFSAGGFAPRAEAILADVAATTGFTVEERLFAGAVLDRAKLGSLIVRGTWQGQPAVLKIQGLPLAVDEGTMLTSFTAQNHSAVIRVPAVFVNEPWQEAHGYGYLILEPISGQPMFRMPCASASEKQQFATFFQSYRTEAVTRPWLAPSSSSSLEFVERAAKLWQKIAAERSPEVVSEVPELLDAYWSVMRQATASIPLVFCHRHLTANDIHVQADGTFALFSNLFWSWRPAWYDLAFNVWACAMHVAEEDVDGDALTREREAWRSTYKAIPVVAADPTFDRTFNAALLERALGALLIDLPKRPRLRAAVRQQFNWLVVQLAG